LEAGEVTKPQQETQGKEDYLEDDNKENKAFLEEKALDSNK